MRRKRPAFLQKRRQLLHIQWRLLGGGLQGARPFRRSEQRAFGSSVRPGPGASLGWMAGRLLQRSAEEAGSGPPGPFAVAHDLLQHLGREACRAAEKGAEKAIGSLGVVQRPVRMFLFDSQHLRQRVQAIPLGMRDEHAGQLECVEQFVLKQQGVRAQEFQIEPDAVADDGTLANETGQPGQHAVQTGCAGHIVVADAGQFGDLERNRPARIDERGEGVQHFIFAELDRSDLSDGIPVGVEAGGLQVEGHIIRKFCKSCSHTYLPSLHSSLISSQANQPAC